MLRTFNYSVSGECSEQDTWFPCHADCPCGAAWQLSAVFRFSTENSLATTPNHLHLAVRLHAVLS